MRPNLGFLGYSKLFLGCLSAIFIAEKPSWALPFKPSPQSFQQYANTIKWGGSARLYFEKFYNCSQGSYSLPNGNSPRIVSVIGWIELWKTYMRKTFSYDGLATDETRRAEAEINEYNKQLQKFRNEDKFTYETYSCLGYVTESDPQGKKVCRSSVRYDGRSGMRYDGYNCVWR